MPLLHKLWAHCKMLWQYLGAPYPEHNEEHGERLHALAHDAYDHSNQHTGAQLDKFMADYFDRQVAYRAFLREEGRTRELLCWAVLEGKADTVKMLLESGAKANSRDEDGDAVIHLAAGHGEHRIIRMLIDAAADVESRDHEGATPLVLACIGGHADSAFALLSAGALVGSKWQHLRPIQWAAKHGHAQVVTICQKFGGWPDEAVPAGTYLAAIATARLGKFNRLQPVPRQVNVWDGDLWTGQSLLGQIQTEDATAGPGKGALSRSHSDLAGLGPALRKYFDPQARTQNRKVLPASTVESMSLRPGIKLRSDSQDVHVQAAPELIASIFGAPEPLVAR
jgi:hypothetical protein